MDPITISLPSPKEWHGKMVREVKVNPPSSRLYLKLGEPRTVVRNGDGAAFYVEKDETIRAYIDEMVDHDDGIDFIGTLDLVTAKRIKVAVLGFFDRADAIIYAPASEHSSST